MTGLRPPGRHAGFVLPAVLVILLALGLVGAAAALLTSTEVRVAGMTGIAHRAEDAAAAGLEHAVAHFGADGPTEGWPVEGEVEGFDYVVSIVADSFDFGSGRAAVHWSAGALNDTGDGQPVWVLTSRALRGSWRASEVLRVTASGLDIRIDSAIAAGHSVIPASRAKCGANVSPARGRRS